MNEEQDNYVSSVKQSSEILLGIINDILEISTLQNGKIAFEDKNFDLYQVLSNLVNVMQYTRSMKKTLRFKLNIEPDVPKFIIGDKLQVKSNFIQPCRKCGEIYGQRFRKGNGEKNCRKRLKKFT